MKKPKKLIADRLLPVRRVASPTPEDLPLATLFAGVEPLDPLPEISAQRIRRRLELELGRSSQSGLPGWFRSAVAAGAALLVLEAAAAATLAAWPAARHRLFGGTGKTLPAPVTPLPASPASGGGVNVAAVSVPSNGGSVAVTPLPASPASGAGGGGNSSAGTQGGVTRRRSKVLAPIPPAPTMAPSAEDPDVALYTQALSQLNAQRDPVAALGTLRAYRFQHPNGLFRNEAAVAEIRAELSLGRETEALSLLDAMHAHSFAGIPQASELTLLRAELLGRADRCDEALPALAPYLEEGSPAGDRERALYARAACRAQVGDADGSRTDLRAYLGEFPQGRFAAKVRAQLGRP